MKPWGASNCQCHAVDPQSRALRHAELSAGHSGVQPIHTFDNLFVRIPNHLRMVDQNDVLLCLRQHAHEVGEFLFVR